METNFKKIPRRKAWKGKMKGIILAGGLGTRLYPLTQVLSKHLLPIHDKPMIYYPLSTLMSAKIRDILIISSPTDLPLFKKLLGDGSKFGIKLSYIEQKEPKGIAESFLIAQDFIANQNVTLVLGDNIFQGIDFQSILPKNKLKDLKGAKIFSYEVSDPERFGVVTLEKNKPVKIEEKPKNPSSNKAVVGLYVYDKNVVQYASILKPSKRGELEITDLNKIYMSKNKLEVIQLNKGVAWLDTGTYSSLNEASQFISTIEKRQGIKIGCIEEISYLNGWISKKEIKANAKNLSSTDYGAYLGKLARKSE